MEDRSVLISDVDGTLLGDDDSLRRFSDWFDRHRDRLRLVYCSGRRFESIADSVASTPLPEPDAVIGGVGTEIHCFETGQPIGNWPQTGPGWQPGRVLSVLAGFDRLELQPSELLSEFKISYYARDAQPEFLDELGRQLRHAGCEVELVYSSARDLDVLPAGVNKGSAAAYLAAHWSCPPDRVFVSGDTGNDLAMFQFGFRGIVVANAHPELKRLDSTSTFQASRPHAAGVLEGLTHWM